MFAELANALRQNSTGAKAGSELSSWVGAIRRLKRRGLLTAAREQALANIGFKWQPGDDRWDTMFRKLAEYRNRHGDCLVPWKWVEDPALATWVRTQRSFRSAGRLSGERVAMLEKIGFSWDNLGKSARGPNESWDRMLVRLVAFAEKYGHTRVPQTYTDDQKLGRWVSTQRQHYRNGKLSTERIKRLESAGFTWGISSVGTAPGVLIPIFEERWQRMVGTLREFKATYGHCRVPTGWKENPSLANWVGVQRRAMKTGRLSRQRAAILDELGFSWRPTPAPAFRPASPSATWADMLHELKEFKNDHGDCRVPQRWNKNRRLADWVSDQRRLFKKGRLSAEQQVALAEIGFDWDPTSSKWETMFSQLQEFKAQHGHVNVPGASREYARLSNWVKNQRRDKKLGRPIAVDRAKRLDQLGFVWAFMAPTPWEDMFAQLVEFKRVHGHCNVPQRWAENIKLGRWVNTQRWRTTRLTPERRQKLDDLGFVWNAAMVANPSANAVGSGFAAMNAPIVS